MSVVFMAFFTLVIAEFLGEKPAIVLFPLLLFTGLASVVYWLWSESLGQGDLRLYILVQFLPILLLPVILWLYQPRFTESYFYWWVLVCYACAKGFEHFDPMVYEFTGIVSGHTMKHLVSSLAVLLIAQMLNHRKSIKSEKQ